MSRAINIQATEDELAALCVKLGLGVSVIEPLASGGTRIVLDTADGAASLRIAMKKFVIETPVKRSPLHLARTQPSYL